MQSKLALMDLLQRMAGPPAFMSSDTVNATRAQPDYSSPNAQCEVIGARQGLLNKLQHWHVVDMPATRS